MQLSRNFSLQELTKSDTAVRKGINNSSFSHELYEIMTASFGIGMFFYGMVCILIGAIAVYYVINKLNKTPEQIEQEENEKYLNELKGKL